MQNNGGEECTNCRKNVESGGGDDRVSGGAERTEDRIRLACSGGGDAHRRQGNQGEGSRDEPAVQDKEER